MIVFLNGQFVPEDQAVVSVFDRSFLYGDGLFEAVRVWRGKLFRWSQHFERLARGAEFLNLQVPFAPHQLEKFAGRLIAQNEMQDGLLRVTLSRGVGVRGYSPKGADRPFMVITCHGLPVIDPEKPPCWKLVTSSFRVPAGEMISTFKTCNKLPQIMARAEAEAVGADEGLLLNTNAEVAEAASSNLFWIANDEVCTTPLANGVLAGVTRGVVFEICENLGVGCREISINPEALLLAQGVFLSLSSLGIVEAVGLDGHGLIHSPLVREIQRAYAEIVERETG
ncbi:MAG TPA: aminotransferase class IV [Candidatus Eisenbacteria bacterium]|jgi:aminodeoxychorismate lyase|nr:aminotransferase class IV [Candidatus Eisenbacteria bacterium]